jgi:hypothetical protein
MNMDSILRSILTKSTISTNPVKTIPGYTQTKRGKEREPILVCTITHRVISMVHLTGVTKRRKLSGLQRRAKCEDPQGRGNGT